MLSVFCAIIKHKYLKLSIKKAKSFKNRQTSKNQISKQIILQQHPKKSNQNEKTFKKQNHQKQEKTKKHNSTKKANTKQQTLGIFGA
jgi:hypothetical protein